MKTSTPTFVADCLVELRAERAPLVARLDAIDLVIQNLSRIYGLDGPPQAAIEPERRTKERRQYKKRKSAATAIVHPPPAEESPVISSDAAARRGWLLVAIMKSEVGLTLADLRKAFPKIGDKDRDNALQQLKLRGSIRRAGNAWVKVEPAA